MGDISTNPEIATVYYSTVLTRLSPSLINVDIWNCMPNLPLTKNKGGSTSQRNFLIRTTMISLLARGIASNWHGGQWSALYQFASSGIYLVENHLLYLEEIIQEIHRPETALHPFHRSKKDTAELVSLKKFFIKEGKMNNVQTVWGEDFYKIVPLPMLAEPNPQIKPIRRLQ
jgi:hypothetical protein